MSMTWFNSALRRQQLPSPAAIQPIQPFPRINTSHQPLPRPQSTPHTHAHTGRRQRQPRLVSQRHHRGGLQHDGQKGGLLELRQPGRHLRAGGEVSHRSSCIASLVPQPSLVGGHRRHHRQLTRSVVESPFIPSVSKHTHLHTQITASTPPTTPATRATSPCPAPPWPPLRWRAASPASWPRTSAPLAPTPTFLCRS